MNQWTYTKICDVANLILGAVLLFSPWLFGFGSGLPTENAVVSGIVIAVLSIAALAAFAVWEEWLNLIVGLWAIAAPWVLGFQGTTAMTVSVVIGVIVAVLAAIELWLMHQQPPRLTANQ
ncbi:MAG: SPW repeat protein [Xanthobacteraceae bacterium]